MERLKAGDVVKHFKRDLVSKEQRDAGVHLYKILSTAAYDCTNETRVVIYAEIMNEHTVFVREYNQFMSEVDHEKYPDVTCKWRFEKVESLC